MTTVIRNNLLYSQTALIIAGPASHYRMRESNTSTVNVIFCLSRANTWRLKTNLAIEMSQNNTLAHGKL